LVERSARLYPDRIALGRATGDLSYGSLRRRVAGLAGGLRRLGVRAGDRIAILDRNSDEYVETYYAAAFVGAILVPLNSRLAANELRSILREVEPKVLITGTASASLGASVVTDLPALAGFVVSGASSGKALDYEELVSGEASPVDRSGSADSTAYIFYTSGTTGEPKGVCLSARAMLLSAYDAVLGLELTSADVWLHAAPMFHLVDAWAVWAMPLVGGRQATLHFEPRAFLESVEARRVTVTSIPPTLIAMATDAYDREPADLSTLRCVTYGGSPAAESTLARGASVFGCPLLQAYGVSEASGMVSLETEPGRGSAGQPLPNVDVRIVDERGYEVAANTVGEIEIGGARVLNEYWRKGSATEAAVRGGWYLSGDLGRLDEQSRLTIVGRKKDMIISGGENVYPAEIENVLARHPGVLEAAVVGVPDPRWGEKVAALVVTRAGSPPDAPALLAFCRQNIAGYKVPKSISFSTDSLPRIGPGKVDKREVKRRLSQVQRRKHQ
jgi:long-chain acyl-CoA synthetase